MKTLHAALIVARKDLRLYCRDRTGMALGLLLPIALVAVFGFVNHMMTSGGSAFSKATLWIADADQSDASRRFEAALRKSSTLEVEPAANEPATTAAALRQKLVDGEAHHALVIEPGFGATLAKGELPTLKLLRDPDRTIEEQLIAIGLMQATFSALGPDFAAPLTARTLELAGMPKEWRDRTLAMAQSFSSSVASLFKEKQDRDNAAKDDTRNAPDERNNADFSFQELFTQIVPLEREDFRPPARPKQLTYMLAHTVSGIGVMMLMFGLVACAGLLLRERESGTLTRLFLSPATRSSILWGKFLFTLAVGAVQLTLLFTFGAIVFHVDVLRDFATFLIVAITVLVAVTAFGMLVGTWAKTQKQADGVSTLAILVMSAVGGAWFPLQLFTDRLPLPASIAMRCTLTHWAVSSFQGLFWNGLRWSDPKMLTSLGVLWGFALVASVVARRLFERRYVGA